jgi:predicted alpha/beta hydrolase family esterase
LPTPDGQNLERWRQEFHYQVGSLSTVTAAVGHSLGVAFILRLIEEAPNIRLPILISVAGCIEKTGILLFDELNQSFIEDSFRWREIRERVGRSIVIYSDDDPYVSQSNSEALARSLAANTQVLHQSGHINAAAGYVRLPAIMRYLHPESVRQASDV